MSGVFLSFEFFALRFSPLAIPYTLYPNLRRIAMQKQIEYEQAIKTKYPEQIVIAVARTKLAVPTPSR